MNPIETRQLRYFLAVAETLHVGRAAERLHMSQPPLTRQIQALERRVGASLFDRSGRRMTLTEAGAAFRADAERILGALDGAAREAREIDRGERGILRIGFVSTVLYGFLPGLVRDFRAAHPSIELELHELTADAQRDALESGGIDVGFVLCPGAGSGTQTLTMHEEPLIACLPEQHRLARGRKPRIATHSLRTAPFVMFPRALSPGLYDRILQATQAAGFSPRVAQQAVQMQTIVGLVSAGLGVAIVPACMRYLSRPGIAYRSLSPAPPSVETALVKTSAPGRPVAEAFVAFAVSSRKPADA